MAFATITAGMAPDARDEFLEELREDDEDWEVQAEKMYGQLPAG